MHELKTIRIRYFAELKEKAGRDNEEVATDIVDLKGLFEFVASKRGFVADTRSVRVAVNARYVDWKSSFADGDTVVFIPPVSGG